MNSLNMQANAFLMRQQVDSALLMLTKAISLDSTNAQSWANLCGAYLQKGELQRSLEAGEKSIRLDPNNAETAFTMGMVADSLNLHEKSKKLFRRSIAIYKDRIDDNLDDSWQVGNRFNLMFSYFYMGDTAKARETLKYLKIEYPDAKSVQQVERMGIDTARMVLEQAIFSGGEL